MFLLYPSTVVELRGGDWSQGAWRIQSKLQHHDVGGERFRNSGLDIVLAGGCNSISNYSKLRAYYNTSA
jgi:hypothetical protein